MGKYNIKIEGSTLNHSQVGHIEYGTASAVGDDKIIQELQRVQNT